MASFRVYKVDNEIEVMPSSVGYRIFWLNGVDKTAGPDNRGVINKPRREK